MYEKMFLFGLISLICAKLAISSGLCSTVSPCSCVFANKSTIDLSSVGSIEFPRFQEVLFQSGCNITELYSYNPCFAFDSPDKQIEVKDGYKRCIGAAACIKSPGGLDGEFPEEHAIGLQYTATFGGNETFNYIHYTVPGSNQTLKVNLICNKTVKHELRMSQPECKGNSTILELISECACPDGCHSVLPPSSSSPGMSVGSKLLIAFFTILLAYLLLGILWNYCNGSRGAELIPNIEFWNDLPTLIMEGVVFTCSCCSKQSTYGSV